MAATSVSSFSPEGEITLVLSDLERFSRRFVINPITGCWNWVAGTYSKSGYGYFSVKSKNTTAHRVLYQVMRGKLQTDQHLDHLCWNRKCVNPEHLEVVTIKENVLRGFGITARSLRATHCKNGHEFTEENTYRRPDRPHTRTCKACGKARAKEYNQATRKRG